MTFSVNSPAGTPAGTSATWNPGSTPTWHGRATPWNSKMRRKTLSQLRRDRKRREAFIAKKCADADVKVENCVKPELEQVCSNPADVEDEIELTEISDESANNECKLGELIKIEGTYKNPKFISWSKLNPTEEVKIMWDTIKQESEVKGIEEIGEASASLPHSGPTWDFNSA